ncbi:MAG: ABC-F family ATP-binding cassette domain-containing protein [Roseburia sp.]|nr:ABC-F family ATP-binding cassette domain-containing protein [Roseburia sp.]
MLTVENLTFSFSDKDLYTNISFSLEDGQHCAFIGSNGTGKTTLIDMLMNTEEYIYDGKISKDENLRIGYVSQVSKSNKDKDITVFDFLSEEFVRNQEENARLCEEMATAEDLDAIYEEYQKVLDEFAAMDGDHYESNIRKQLKIAGLAKLENLEIAKLSGGEFKLVQIIKQMILQPSLLIMDEPDVFLDFHNLNGLRDLINAHSGTLLVVTHNRYLLNHCFNKILHLENADIQEFDGNYMDYNLALLLKKIELQELAAKDLEEIERTRKMVERLRNEATKIDSAQKGRSLKAKATQLARLEARRIKEPFVNVRQPKIKLPELAETEGKVLLTVNNYSLSFDELLLEDVTFELHEGEKIAMVGPNGTGKTTLLREINANNNPAIQLSEDAEIGFLSQIHGETLNEANTVYKEMEEIGFETKTQIEKYLADYCFEEDHLNRKVDILSGGEKNLLQLAKIGCGNANLLLLDEPTSHLDTYSQLALEKALEEYKGAVLMVSHDFYSIANCVDAVLFVEEKTVRKMRIRSFRKMIYENHFDKDYLELEQQKKQLETRIEGLLKASDYESAKAVSEDLEAVVAKMRGID